MGSDYVTPRDCALAIGIPLTTEDFVTALERPYDGNYAQCIRHPHKSPLEIHLPIARYIEDACQMATKLGATVVREVQAVTLRELLASFPVVTLVTHCFLARIQPQDIIAPAALLKMLLTSHEESRVLAVKEAIEVRAPSLLTQDVSLSEAQLANEFARVLDEIVTTAHGWYLHGSLQSSALQLRAYPVERLSRITLEVTFPKHISPCPAIELGPKMYTVPEIVEIIPTGYDGILDLTVCNSALLGQSIKQRHPKCLVAVHQHPITPVERFMRYRMLIGELSRKNTTFMDALESVHSITLG